MVYRFEAGGQGQHSIQKAPILKGATFSRAEAVGWLESVTAALDCYNWVFKEQLFSPSELFDGKNIHIVYLEIFCLEKIFTFLPLAFMEEICIPQFFCPVLMIT